MDGMYWKILFFVLWAGTVIIRMPYTRRYKNIKIVKVAGRRREIILVGFATIGMTIVPLIWVFSSLLCDYAMGLPGWVRWLGVLLYCCGLWLFRIVHHSLGNNWSPILEITERHTLVQTGVYQKIRHPMYSLIWLWIIAQWLITSNWCVGISGTVAWATLYYVRVAREEAMMAAHFGDTYRDYMKTTGRLMPKIRL
jgi:protein-S-isoprenylcysteine O-methyltransferase Ste14